MFIYTPPSYERSSARLPVLYLLHGADGDETVWTQFGRANLILDNLIAEKKAAPMVVVMPFGYAYPWHVNVSSADASGAMGAPRSGGAGRGAERGPQRGSRAGVLAAPGSREDKQRADFQKDLLEDLIPFVQTNYRVYADRDHRALAGLSMGGGQTLAIGPRHLDVFSRLAVFSAGAGQNPQQSLADIGANAKTVNSQLKLFWIGIGTEDTGLAGAKRTSDYLNSVGIKHTFKTMPGAHTWIVWRHFLNEVAPLLFSES